MIRHIKEIIIHCLQEIITNKNLNITNVRELVRIERTKHSKYGDISTNAAMVFAKIMTYTTQDLAAIIIKSINDHDNCKNIDRIECVGPGFINITLSNTFLQTEIKKILSLGHKYASSTIYKDKSANVEFVSANPTGPLHTGHARNAVIGSCIANLLEKVGYDVTREFYINDRGGQIDILGKSLYYRYLALCGVDTAREFDTADMYHGDYIKSWAQELYRKYHDNLNNDSNNDINNTKHIKFCADYAVEQVLTSFRDDLADIGVVMDVYTSEKENIKSNKHQEAFDILHNNGDTYIGVLPKPKSMHNNEEWESTPQRLFRSTKYGDDCDRALQKSNGDWTYFATDIAYHYYKLQRRYDKLVNVFGADHVGYVKRIQAAVQSMSTKNKPVDFKIVMYQLVNFLDNGVPVKMSKRSGTFITLKDVVSKVGKDITRFTMISRDSNSVIDFDFASVIEQTLENPLFYIQYCHARICSVFKNYEHIYGNQPFSDELDICSIVNDIDVSYISHDSEMALIKTLSFYPEFVLSCAQTLEPHRLTIYLRELSQDFHYLWNQGKLNNDLRFIDPSNRDKTVARMALLRATQIIICDALQILGITPIAEMK